MEMDFFLFLVHPHLVIDVVLVFGRRRRLVGSQAGKQPEPQRSSSSGDDTMKKNLLEFSILSENY